MRQVKERIRELARDSGFELCGVSDARVGGDFGRYERWLAAGYEAGMKYLDGWRRDVRADAGRLLPGVRSVISVGKLYQTPYPLSVEFDDAERGWISRYAWGEDYHGIVLEGLRELAVRMEREWGRFRWKACVDSSAVLERSYARQAGLGWIGKNTCLIHEGQGSWFFLGELLTDLDLEPDEVAAERCGSCARCIEACPTQAIVPMGDWWAVDSGRCISYLTIEHRGSIDVELEGGMGRHVFGCDICQDVCPWNRRAPVTEELRFLPDECGVDLGEMARLSADEFDEMFAGRPVSRARYAGFLRNVAIAMGNSGRTEFVEALERLASVEEEVVAESARRALVRLGSAR
jgi:epoxyqueuosine reductase